MAAIVGMLLALSIGPVQGFLSGLVMRWGREIHRWISSPGRSNEAMSATGASSGAIAGALLAGLALRLVGPGRRRSEGTPAAQSL